MWKTCWFHDLKHNQQDNKLTEAGYF